MKFVNKFHEIHNFGKKKINNLLSREFSEGKDNDILEHLCKILSRSHSLKGFYLDAKKCINRLIRPR